MIATLGQNEISAAKSVSAAVLGKLGEFLQGVDRQGDPFLYTATLNSAQSGSTATVRPAAPSSSLRISPAPALNQPERAEGSNLEKTERSLRSLLADRDLAPPWDFEVRLLTSPISAKGLGASSSDMAASLLAASRYLGLEITRQELFSLMCAIERSDYLFQPDQIVRANPLSAEFTLYGPIPPMKLLAWDTEPSRTISTEEVAYMDRLRRAYASEYTDLADCCESGNPDAILSAATRSGQINQNFLPKPCFPWALTTAKENKVGLVAAHTGTFMAFAIPPQSLDPGRLAYLETILRNNGFSPVMLQTGSPTPNCFSL